MGNGRKVADLGCHDVVRNDVGHLFEPELGNLGQDEAFVGNALVHDDIESRDAVGGDQQQVFAEVVNVPHFALVDQLEVCKIGLGQRRLHDYNFSFSIEA